MTASHTLKTDATAPPMPSLPGEGIGGNMGEYSRGALEFHERLQRDCGDIAQYNLGPWKIFQVTNPDWVERVFKGSNGEFRKGRGWDATRFLIGNGLIAGEPDNGWLARRRALQPAFVRAYHETFAQTFVQTLQNALPRFHDLAREEKPVFVLHEMTRLAFCNANQTLMGQDPQGKMDHWMPHLIACTDYVNRYYSIPTYKRVLGRFLPQTSHGRFHRSHRVMQKWALQIVQERQAQHARGETFAPDMLSQLLFHPDRSDKRRFSARYVRDEIMTFLFASHETTATTLSWVWWFLSQNPEAEAKLHDELHRVLDGRAPTLQDLEKMPYGRMIIEETLRLRPPVWNMARETTQPEQFGEHTIPKGSMIMLVPWATHRHPDFWENAEQFEPERFSPERSVGRHPFSYVPFGGGPRQCIGRRIALIEVQIALSVLAQSFTLRPAAGYVARPLPQITLRPSENLPMTLHARA